jgi:hypothetical protein
MIRISRYAAQRQVSLRTQTVLGAGMRQAENARRIRAEFIRDPLRPAEASTKDGTGGALDRRRWDGRTGVSCGKH